MLYGFDTTLEQYGLFYSMNWELLGVNCFGIVVVTIWVAFSSVLMFFFIDITIGLRVPVEDELVGLDMKYGGSAYNHEDVSDYGYSDSENSLARSALRTARSGGSERSKRSRDVSSRRRGSISTGF